MKRTKAHQDHATSHVEDMPTARRGRPRSGKSERAILDASMRILISTGYQGLTLDKVAAEASVSKATIYRRWKSKEELVIAALGKLPTFQVRRDGEVLETLTDLIHQFVKMVQNKPSKSLEERRMVTMLPSVVAESANDPALSRALDLFIEQRRAPVRDILTTAISNGELPHTTDLDLAIDGVMAPTVMRLFLGKGDVSRAATRRQIAVFLAGLRAQVD